MKVNSTSGKPELEIFPVAAGIGSNRDVKFGGSPAMVEVASDRRDPPVGNQPVFVYRQGRSGPQKSQRQK